MRLIKRSYLRKLISVMDTPDIKVITGVRRSGKSKLLEQFQEFLRDEVADVNIISVDFNNLENESLSEYHALYDFVERHYQLGKANFVFLDEVQMCEGFEKAVNSLHDSEKYQIYISGSNAFLQDNDLATLFTGRDFPIEVFPFSFREFLRYYELEDIEEAFERYALEGGMAGSYVYETAMQKQDYVAHIYDTLVLRDIEQKYNIRQPEALERVGDFLMDNISKISSMKNIADKLGISEKTVDSYVSYFCKAFLCYRVRRYDIRGKKYLETKNKYYLVDASFRNAKLGVKNADYGYIYENIVAIELLRRGYEVYAGELYNSEIDFVAIKKDKKLYIQVADDIVRPETFEREVRPLLAIRDAYPKLLLARTKHPVSNHEGVEIWNLAEWLAED